MTKTQIREHLEKVLKNFSDEAELAEFFVIVDSEKGQTAYSGEPGLRANLLGHVSAAKQLFIAEWTSNFEMKSVKKK